MAQDTKRRNAEYIKQGSGEDRDKRVEDMGAQAKQHAANMHAINTTDPNVKVAANKRVSNKVTNKQAAQAMSGTSYSKLLKVK